MSGSVPPGSPPPEVPEEFAAAYRAAYEQALAAQSGGAQHREDPRAEETGRGDDTTDTHDLEDLPARRGPIRIATHRDEVEYAGDDSPTWFEEVRDSSWFVPFLLILLALLLVFGAYVVGKSFAGQVAAGASSDDEPRVVIGAGGGNGERQPVTNQKAGKGAWDGTVRPITGVRASAGCTSKAGVDASGAKVSYDAGNLTDGAAETTWRCNGPAIGEKITIDLGTRLPVGEVGLVPGYAKTDDTSKVDRFAENNRVTRVRWTVGGTQVVQQLSGSPKDRSLQLLRIPRTTADKVTMEILAVRKGPRDTTAISEVRLGRAG